MKEKYEMKCCEGDHPRILVTQEFVKENNLKLIRSEDEIVKRISEKQELFNFEPEVLSDYVSFEKTKYMFNKEDIAKVESGEEEIPKSVSDVYEAAQDFLDYMVFGWMKALDERGLSAGRAILKLGAWLWLLGRDDLYEIINDDNLYDPSGSPALIAVCEKMGINVPDDLIEFAKRG